MISIHAPAWGATKMVLTKTLAPTISIHAPAWGATDSNFSCRGQTSHFNPRARVGRDCACLHGLNYSGCAIFFANLILSVLLQAFFVAKSSV